ncbi:hypothetical protein BAL199_04744 [alpha proteobacterium BAL199]|jgi:hypothetical protein|nr:hypothetical protein BAL199_04744 [alpha proteobacterium BAL199]
MLRTLFYTSDRSDKPASLDTGVVRLDQVTLADD